jgi:hypothetical protein
MPYDFKNQIEDDDQVTAGDAMAEDVRAAESRRRTGVYTEDEEAVDQVFKDMRTLASAYLALAAEVRAVLADMDATPRRSQGGINGYRDRLRAAVGEGK